MKKKECGNESLMKAIMKKEVYEEMSSLQRERHHKESTMHLRKMKARVNKIVENAMDFLKRIQ